MRRLHARPITAAAFAPFGTLIDAAAKSPEAINDGTTQRHSDLATLDLRDPVLGIYVAQARSLPLRIAKVERHREAAQVFLPPGDHRFIVLAAAGADAPDWQRPRGDRARRLNQASVKLSVPRLPNVVVSLSPGLSHTCLSLG